METPPLRGSFIRMKKVVRVNLKILNLIQQTMLITTSQVAASQVALQKAWPRGELHEANKRNGSMAVGLIAKD